MLWTSSSNDSFHSKGDNVQMKFPNLNSAVDFATMMGYGVDVQYPNFKWHAYKNYADNFKYKGEAKPEADYD